LAMADAFPSCGVLGAKTLRVKERSALDGVISENSVHMHAVVGGGGERPTTGSLEVGSQDSFPCLSGMPAHNQTVVGP
jgi:hypothetical protein